MVTRSAAAVMSVGLIAALAACGAGGEASPLGGEWTAERDTVGDTVVVRTVAGSVWGESAALVPELSIGVLEGETEYILGEVDGLAVDGAGDIYIYDEQVPALRKYDADGRHLTTFGREGGGPGEYKNSDGGLAVLADGRVLLRDPGNARINVYSPEGEPLDHWRIRGGYYTSSPTVVDTAGNVYTPLFGDIDGMLKFSPAGEVLDTILEPEWEYDRPTLSAEGETESGGRVISAGSVPFSPRVATAFSPLGYMVGGLSTRYAIDLFRPDGSVLRLGRAAEPVPVAGGEREYREYTIWERYRGIDPNWRWDGPSIPETKPPFRRIFIGRHGRVWVQLHRPGVRAPAEAVTDDADPDSPPPWREPIAFDLFEPDGRYLGQVRAPDGFQTFPHPVFGRDRVWAVAEDDLGVQSVVRFRIDRGGPPDVE